MRRDKNDEAWQACKKVVYQLDGNMCCLCKCMTFAEQAKQQAFFKKQGSTGNLSTIDPAHHIPVSSDISIMYDPNNVYCMCRWHHHNLDNLMNPFDQSPMTQEEAEAYWQRAMNTRYKDEIEKPLPGFFYDEL